MRATRRQGWGLGGTLASRPTSKPGVAPPPPPSQTEDHVVQLRAASPAAPHPPLPPRLPRPPPARAPAMAPPPPPHCRHDGVTARTPCIAATRRTRASRPRGGGACVAAAVAPPQLADPQCRRSSLPAPVAGATIDAVDFAAIQHDAGPSRICPKVEIAAATLLPCQPGRTRRIHRGIARIATSRTSWRAWVDARALREDVVNSFTAQF